MDAETLSPAVYAEVLKGLARVNIATLTPRSTLDFLKRSNAKSFRLLDVGYGDGGMLRAIWKWAQKRGIACELVGVDLNPRSEAVAAARHIYGANIRYRTGDYADLAGEPWDFVISSLVTHHMSDSQRLHFLTFMEQVSARGWFVNDLHRHRFAYHGYPLLARLLSVHRIVREDGQLSIARSFRPTEWKAMLAATHLDGVAQVKRVFPFRLCVERYK